MKITDEVKKFGQYVSFKENQTVIKLNGYAGCVYIIYSGMVAIFSYDTPNSPELYKTLKPGDYFGEFSPYTNFPKNTVYIAISDCVALMMSQCDFLYCVSQQSDIAFDLLKILYDKNRILSGQITKVNLNSPVIFTIPQNVPPQPVSPLAMPKINSEPEEHNNSPVNLLPLTASAKNVLCPEWHPDSIDIKAPISYNSYLYDKSNICPVCDKSFTAQALRKSRLRIERTESNFRKYFFDIEPLWYQIWVCPNCLYADFFSTFATFPTNCIKKLNANMRDLSGYTFGFSQVRDIQEVFLSYFLCLKTTQTYTENPYKKGLVWVNLSWLYQEAGYEELFYKASQNAYEAYMDAYNSSSMNISAEQEQQIYIRIGELAYLCRDTNMAYKFFMQASMTGGGSPLLRNLASDRMTELKNLKNQA